MDALATARNKHRHSRRSLPQAAVQVWDERIERIEGTVGLAQADIVTDAVCPLYQVSRLTGNVEFLTIPTWLVDLKAVVTRLNARHVALSLWRR